MIFEWIYTGPHVPRPEQPRVHLNLWKLVGIPTADQEVIVSEFNFSPIGATGKIIDNLVIIKEFQLQQNYPNPFNPATTISFSTTENAKNTVLIIYNIKGQKVKQLFDDLMPVGQHSIVWDGKDESGKHVSAGIYFYQLRAGSSIQIKKMLILK